MQTSQIIWLVLLFGFFVLEAATAALVSIWFCAGSLGAFLVALFFPQAYVLQVAVFLVISVAAILALRPFARRLTGGQRVPTNADANIGKMCQVISAVQPGRVGRVKVEGQDWAAISETPMLVGTWCRIEAIEGVKLVVTPLPPEEAPPGGRL